MTPIDTDALRRQYASLADNALLEIDRDHLVDAAQACWDDEVIARRLAVELPAPPEQPLAINPEPPASPHRQGTIGEFITHAAIAIFGVGQLVSWIPFFAYPDMRANFLRGDVVNAVFAIALGYFVHGLWPLLSARWLWITGVAWLCVGALRGGALVELYSSQPFESTVGGGVALLHLSWSFYTATAIRLCFYSVGAWGFSRFPIPQLRGLKARLPAPREAPSNSSKPAIARLPLRAVQYVAQCAIAVVAGGWIGNQLVPFLSIAVFSISMETGLLAWNLAYALGGMSLGYGMHRLWRSPLATWVWIAGVLWFGLRGLIGSSLSADLDAASTALPPDEAAALKEWALYTSAAILAVFYSLGAWLHARLASQPATLTEEPT